MADTALVSGSRFEELIIKIHKDEEANLIKLRNEEEANLASKLNQGRRRDLFKSICSAYFFLREVAGMTKRDMALEEFEIVEEKLKEMAKEEAKKFRHKVLKLFGFKTAWLYYNKFGHFHVERTPFGNWYKKHPWYKSGFSDPERYSWYVFKPERSINEVGDASVFPPNALRLLNEVFEKRYGAK